MAFITKNVAIDQGAFTGETYTGMEATDEFPTKDELRKNWCYNPLKSGFQDYNSNDFVDNGDYLEPLTLGTGMCFGEQGSEFKAGSTVYLGGFSSPGGSNYTEDGYTGGTIMGNIGGSTANYQYLGMVEPDTWYYVSALMKITDVSLLDNTQINNIFFIQNASYMGSDSFGLGIQTSGRLAITYNPASSPLNNQQVNTLSSDTFTLANNVWYLVTLAWNPTLLIGIGIIERDGERVVVKGARCISNVFRFSSGHQLRATFGSNQNITCKWIKSYIGAVPNETFTRGLTKLASIRFTPMRYNHTGNMIGYAALTSMEVAGNKSPKGIINFANNYSYTNPASATGVAVDSLPYRGMKFTSMPSLAELGVEDPGSVAGDKFVVDFIVYFDGHKPTTNDANEDGHQYYCIGGINYSYPYQDVTDGFRGANTILYGDLNSNTFHIGTMNYNTASSPGLTRISVSSSGSINLDLDYTKPYIFRLYYPSYGAAGQFDILDYNTREVLGTWSGSIAGGALRKPALSILIGSCSVSVTTMSKTYYENIGTVSNLIYLGVDTYTTVGQDESGKILKYLSDYSCVYQNNIMTWTGPSISGGSGNSSSLSGGYFQNNTGSMHLSGLKLASNNVSDFPLSFSSTTHLYNYPFSIGNDEWIHYRYTITLDTSISITNNTYRALASIVGAKIDSNSCDLFEIALVFMQTSSSTFSLYSWLNINSGDATRSKLIKSGISYDTLRGESEDITILWDVIFNKNGNVLQTMCYDMNGRLIGSSADFTEVDFNTSENPNGTKNAIYVFNPYVGVHPRAQVLNSNPSYSYGNIGIIRQLAITHNHYYESL